LRELLTVGSLTPSLPTNLAVVQSVNELVHGPKPLFEARRIPLHAAIVVHIGIRHDRRPRYLLSYARFTDVAAVDER